LIRTSNIHLLFCLSLGFVYLFFGTLKFFPGASPAEGLAINTIDQLFNGLIPARISILTLAVWEVLLGILFLLRRNLRVAVVLGLIHMALTFTPIFFFPDASFTDFPKPTLLTQYILKNLVFIVAMMAVYPGKR